MLQHKLATDVERVNDINELRLMVHDLRDFCSDLVDTLNFITDRHRVPQPPLH
jgi:hypothetical protein